MNRIAQIILVTVLLVGPGIATTQAALMYATSASPGQLWTVDTDTAATSLVGGMPFSASLTTAYDIAENRIYTFDNASNQLYSIDPTNGTGSVVGTLPLPYNFVHGFAYDPISDVLYAHDNDTGALFTIDTADASTTLIGYTGWRKVGGIEYDFVNGILYGIDWNNYGDDNGPRLLKIDPATAATTVLGSLSGVNVLVACLGFNPEDGMLYTSLDSHELLRINPETLATTIVGTTSKRLSGLSFMTVPEPATMSLLGFGAMGLMARRKRRK